MMEWRAFMAKYMPDGETTDANYVYAYGVASIMLATLKQCGDDFSRENVMKQAANVKTVALPLLLPGMAAATTPTDFLPLKDEHLSSSAQSSAPDAAALKGGPEPCGFRAACVFRRR